MTSNRIGFAGTYSDWKLIKTRSCVQVVIEVDLSAADAAYQVLGGMPSPGESIWLKVSRIGQEQREEVVDHEARNSKRANADSSKPHDSPPRPAHGDPKPVGADKPKRLWDDMGPAQQAGVLCNDKVFRLFLAEQYQSFCSEVDLEIKRTEVEFAAEVLRGICGVDSRKELAENHKARVIFHQLVGQYRMWKDYPELVA